MKKGKERKGGQNNFIIIEIIEKETKVSRKYKDIQKEGEVESKKEKKVRRHK